VKTTVLITLFTYKFTIKINKLVGRLILSR